MSEPADLDRNEEATPYRLDKARERGQVPRSAELSAALVLMAAATWLLWRGAQAWEVQLQLMRLPLEQAGRVEPGAAGLWPLAAGLLQAAAAQLLPLLLGLAGMAVAATLLQTGPLFALQALQADAARLDPVQGLARLLSRRALFDALRSLLKLLVFASVSWMLVTSLLPGWRALALATPGRLAQVILGDASALATRLALAAVLLALVDFAYTRREFAQRMRMSRRELREEHRQREGDPRIRARLRELRRETLRRVAAASRTGSASVVLTNPTHVAVALRYVEGQMAAPALVAKGAGSLAGMMRRLAATHGVPVIASPPLAREIFHQVEVGQSVPPSLYADIARILVWLEAMRRQRQPGAPA